MDQYEGLREKLKKQNFPCKYMFKFITSQDNISELKTYFKDAEVKTKPSSKGKYVSFTAVIMTLNADQIIDRYKSLSHIQGLISL